MSYENRKWVILTASEAEGIDYDEIMERESKLVWNTDNTKTFVKYEGDQPSFLNGKTELTHTQILTELAKDEWIKDAP